MLRLFQIELRLRKTLSDAKFEKHYGGRYLKYEEGHIDGGYVEMEVSLSFKISY